MRQKRSPQLSVFNALALTEIGKELAAISLIIDETPRMLDPIYRDLVGVKQTYNGRTGMTAEQVLRCAILKQYRNLSYEELAFHLSDSRTFRTFARLERTQHPSASTLQENIKSLSEETWEAINNAVMTKASEAGIENRGTVRIDSTAVECDVHFPTDSTLLQDGIRVITRLIIEGKRLFPTPHYHFSDHRRVVKKRVLKIKDSRKETVRRSCYKDLLDFAELVRGYAGSAVAVLAGYKSFDPEQVIQARILVEKLERALGLLSRIIDQTRRRVINEEKVPASEKIVSFFECHSDIIEKGNRETTYGHKVFLTGGESGLILDCVIERGNSADSSMFVPLMDRQKEIYGRFPRQVAADGGFASEANLKAGKANGIKDIAFAKRRGISILEMVKSTWVYKKLRNFRAGIEANISVLKRAFGLFRCTWTGWHGFVRCVRSAVVAYNLLVLGRLKTSQA
ncbi:MAG: ISNCY family transposase [Syntrophobacteraceae bacterium]